MWGTFWVWDARLTSVFISFLIYLGALRFQKLPVEPASISICVGPIDIPIIKSSVNWWNTSHQPGSISRSGTSIHPGYCLSLSSLSVNWGQECLKRELSEGEEVYARSKPYIVVFVSSVPPPPYSSFLCNSCLANERLALRLKKLYKRQCYQRCLAAWNVFSSSPGLWNGRIGSASTLGFFLRLQERKAMPASSLVWHSKEQQLPRRLESIPSYTFYLTYVLSFGITFYHTGGKNPSWFKNSPNWDIHSKLETITNEKKGVRKGLRKNSFKRKDASSKPVKLRLSLSLSKNGLSPHRAGCVNPIYAYIMIWKGIVKWKKTVRFILTGSHSVSRALNFAAGVVFYISTGKPHSCGRIETLLLAQHVFNYSSIALEEPF
ncbi:hypothetical protein GOBAR_AA14325 [Gossypium barbadense]|uniref:Cytochrome c assembly protein domain-containing protein n=1 Tax=Gossypium barbadense TaxID=3634 RepID=A0A2P5XSL2_GOSBA|nr:hypothetical protein GOBAR_AA14325 [Gossypium barbadense]